MDEDQWTYDYTMSQEVDYDNEEECGVNEPHVDCSNAFNTCQVFGTRDDVLQWARIVAHENRFVAVIMRSDTDTGSRGRSSFVLIGVKGVVCTSVGIKNSLEETLRVGNVVVPSGFVGKQGMKGKVGW
ncbi:hypothetical protein GmHk_18G052633 [Glycine max]|nr:hypothetical protein GmHk_18G052633 [Glycine max]KAH1199220.1 hypothetical protein GmHk_18G052633 [Glycine max]